MSGLSYPPPSNYPPNRLPKRLHRSVAAPKACGGEASRGCDARYAKSTSLAVTLELQSVLSGGKRIGAFVAAFCGAALLVVVAFERRGLVGEAELA